VKLFTLAVAAELDSFDGRKDPDRCSCLVNKLRNCQDKLLTICAEMLEQLEPGHSKRSREFRAKFPGKETSTNLKLKLLNLKMFQYLTHFRWSPLIIFRRKF